MLADQQSGREFATESPSQASPSASKIFLRKAERDDLWETTPIYTLNYWFTSLWRGQCSALTHI